MEQQTFPVSSHIVNIRGIYSRLQLLNSAITTWKRRQYVNEWAWLHANKTLFTNVGRRPDVAPVMWFAHAWQGWLLQLLLSLLLTALTRKKTGLCAWAGNWLSRIKHSPSSGDNMLQVRFCQHHSPRSQLPWLPLPALEGTCPSPLNSGTP